jgi:hypothetical protein
MDPTLSRNSLQFALGLSVTNFKYKEAFTSNGWLQQPERSY